MGQYSKYKLYYKEEFDGEQWSPVIPLEYYAEMIEEFSTDCGYEPLYRTDYESNLCEDDIPFEYSTSAIVRTYTECIGFDKFECIEVHYYDSNNNKVGQIIFKHRLEKNSTDCGYEEP